MYAEGDSFQIWDGLHQQARHKLRYPSEHAVRFLARCFPQGAPAATRGLDIGTGGGRHTKLLCDFGIEAAGIDFSGEAIRNCKQLLEASGQSASLRQATMLNVPFPDEHFHVAISYGVYYYGDTAAMAQAVSELHRLLRVGGAGFVVLRTDRDYRHGKGPCIEPNTFKIDVEDTNEFGTLQHFLPESEVRSLFAAFADVQFEMTETTFNNRLCVNSDWLITVKK
jgi:SAM-dependent methyltransferase